MNCAMVSLLLCELDPEIFLGKTMVDSFLFSYEGRRRMFISAPSLPIRGTRHAKRIPNATPTSTAFSGAISCGTHLTFIAAVNFVRVALPSSDTTSAIRDPTSTDRGLGNQSSSRSLPGNEEITGSIHFMSPTFARRRYPPNQTCRRAHVSPLPSQCIFFFVAGRAFLSPLGDGSLDLSWRRAIPLYPRPIA